MNRRNLARGVVTVAAGLALMGSAPAFAENLTSSFNSAYAWSKDGSYNNRTVAVKDTGDDGFPVYTNYDRKKNRGLRMDNRKGYGASVYSGANESNPVTAVQACVNVPHWPDSCASYDRPGDGK